MLMIKEFLLSRKKILLLWGITLLLYPFLAFLWNQSLAASLYGDVLISVVFLSVLLWEFYNYEKTRKILGLLKSNLPFPTSLWQKRPTAEDGDYYDVIKSLADALLREKENAAEQRREEHQYYSLWVHQIKTPIAAISLALESDAANKALLEQEVFKIGQYAEMALDYAKLANFSSDLMLQPCDLQTVVKSALRKCATLFIYKKISVTVSPMEKTVITDEKWLVFILEQLLTNAVKYTEEGSVTIALEGDTLTISDTGIGIRAEDKERIFEMGFTGYNGRLDKNASGIGLYLVKQVSTPLGITVDVMSEIGKGTTMALTFLKPPTMTAM